MEQVFFFICASLGYADDLVMSTIKEDIPYKDGVCVIIPDRSKSGKLEAFQSCWKESRVLIAPQSSWIFTYNAMPDYKGPVGE